MNKISVLLSCFILFLSVFGCNHVEGIESFGKDPAPITLSGQTIELPYNHTGAPTLQDGDLYVPVGHHADFTNKIVKYNLQDKSAEFIFESKVINPVGWSHVGIHPLISNEKWLIWFEEVQSEKTPPANSKLWMRNLQTGHNQVIYETPWNQSLKPSLYGDQVVFHDPKDGYLKSIHLPTRQIKNIDHSVALLSASFDSEAEQIHWLEKKDTGYQLKTYSFETGKLQATLLSQLPQINIISMQSLADGNLVICSGDVNRGDFSLWLYDLKQKRFESLVSKSSYWFTVFDNRLIYLDEKHQVKALEILQDQAKEVQVPSHFKQADFMRRSSQHVLFQHSKTDKQKVVGSVISLWDLKQFTK